MPVKKKAKKKKGPPRKRMSPLRTTEVEPGPLGRPVEFTPELGSELCARIMMGKSVQKICASDDMPAKMTVFRWLAKGDDPSGPEDLKIFRYQYAQAVAIRREYKFDSLEHDLTDMTLQPVIIDGVPLTVEEGGETVMVRSATNVSVQYAKLMLDAFKWQSSKENPKKYSEKTTQELVGPNGGAIQHGISVSFVASNK